MDQARLTYQTYLKDLPDINRQLKRVSLCIIPNTFLPLRGPALLMSEFGPYQGF